MSLGNLRECLEACHEVLLLPLHLELEVSSQGLVAQGGNKNRLRHHRRISRYSIRQLIDVAEDSRLQQSIDNLLARKGTRITLAEVHKLLLRVSIHPDAEHFTTLTTHHLADSTADGRGELNLGILLVDKQCIPGLDLVAFVNDHLRSDPFEIIGHKCKLAVRLQLDLRLLSTSLKVDVQAFA